MASFWFFKLALMCIDLLSWPLLALGYPLCASIQAIESDSHSETLNLISYWILLSLIYLFEYAFLKLLQWFHFWPYLKLMIIMWLMIPDFGRAFYAYKCLLHLCNSMNPRAVMSRCRNRENLFVKKENFLLQIEKYIEENGSEALKQLIASENTVPTAEKNEVQPVKTNQVRLHMEQKDIKELEMIQKEEVVHESKQGNTASCSLKPNENTSSAVEITKGTVEKDTAGGESSQISASKKVQKEWTCAICQVTTSSEKNLKSHLYGRKHKAACEALKAKIQHAASVKKNDKSKEETKKMMDTANALKRKMVADQQAKIKEKNVQISNVQEYVKLKWEHEKSILGEAPKQQTIKDQENKKKEVHGNNTKVKELKKVVVGMNSSRLRCEICNVKCTSEVDMASHLNGRKHLAQIDLGK